MKYLLVFDSMQEYITAYDGIVRPDVSIIDNIGITKEFSVRYDYGSDTTYYVDDIKLVDICNSDSILFDQIDDPNAEEEPVLGDVSYIWSCYHKNLNKADDSINEGYSDMEQIISFTLPDLSDIKHWGIYTLIGDYKEPWRVYLPSYYWWNNESHPDLTLSVTNQVSGDMDLLHYNKMRKHITFDPRTSDENKKFTVTETDMTSDDLFHGNTITVNLITDTGTVTCIARLYNGYKVNISHYDIHGVYCANLLYKVVEGFRIDNDLNIYDISGMIPN
jgi:hypothetical protein